VLENKWASEDDLNKVDKDIKAVVNAAAEFATHDAEPDPSELWTDILV
jgi:pyruvate dehydrogenase E1 component alpha subunit